jgi:hypothetical protein
LQQPVACRLMYSYDSCFSPSRPLAAPQVAASVAKKTPADKQLQRDARAIVKKSMVHAEPAVHASASVSGHPPLLSQDAAQWTSSVLSGDRFVSHSSSAAAAAAPISGACVLDRLH